MTLARSAIHGALLVVIPTLVAAQAPATGVVTGRIGARPDSATLTSTPIIGVTVTIAGAPPTTSDSAGRYTLTIRSDPHGPGAGDYEFKVWDVPAPVAATLPIGPHVSPVEAR